MAQPYREFRENPGFGKKLGDSFKGILLGIVIFLAAFPLLWWGENRKNTAEFVDEATEVSSAVVPEVAKKTLVKTTGKLTTSEMLLDSTYLTSLGEERAMRLERAVAMYAYVEHKETKEGTDPATGKKGQIDEYTYTQEWTSVPAKSFKDPNQPKNPGMVEKAEDFQVKSAKIGEVLFAADKANFRGLKELVVTEALVNKAGPKVPQVVSGEIYLPFQAEPSWGTPRNIAQTPKVGDMKISYRYFPAGGDGALVGAWDGGKIVPHVYNETDTFLAVYNGTLAELRANLQSEHNIITWIIRIASFFMMFFGMNAVLGPILTVLDSIPIVGGAGRAVISLVTFVMAAVLWFVTFILAKYLWLILILALAAIAGLFYFVKKKGAAPAGAVAA